VADIMVGSFYDPTLDEGCAFEELISFHGGLGGPQTRPFILSPQRLPLPAQPIIGAAAVHELLWSWRRAVQPAPDRTAPAAAASSARARDRRAITAVARGPHTAAGRRALRQLQRLTTSDPTDRARICTRRCDVRPTSRRLALLAAAFAQSRLTAGDTRGSPETGPKSFRAVSPGE
jgi:hypothetical protein